MTVLEKLEKVLQDQHDIYSEQEYTEDFDEDDIVIEKMFDFIESIEPDQLTDDQADMLYDIMDMLAPEDEETNEVFKRRVRRDIVTRRKRRREYRRKRTQVKIRARKYRRSAKGKMTLRKAKRYGKYGRTSKMKRQRKFIGPK